MNHKDDKIVIVCPTCKSSFQRRETREKQHPLIFCAYCGTNLNPEKKLHQISDKDISSQFSFVSGHSPNPSEVQGTVGRYQLIKSIGKGGMGEVFIAFDPICGRKIALKRIRPDLIEHPQLHKRFLREAKITSQLTHPTIIPIYSIHAEGNEIYYTMPYVEGETLKQVIKKAHEHERKRELAKNPQYSIPSLIRIFLQVCQACAYAHSHDVLHRDLKPENFIVGKYGQVLILDWGLAKLLKGDTENENLPEIPISSHASLQKITKIGKVVGTIAFMAPERALGQPATIQTDIYSLGVILYQILTLQIPFRRKSLSYFKKHWKDEQLVPPEVMAPYRDVPQILSQIVSKCLAIDPRERYATCDELIQSLENYIEGRSEWFPIHVLDINKKEDWEFQENILLAEHTAITQPTEVSDWVTLMISKDAFNDNAKIEAEVLIGEKGQGLGFLLSLPEALDRQHLTEGYCLWLASDRKDVTKRTKLLRSSISVLEVSDLVLKRGIWQKIRIEKVDQHIHVYLNDVLQFSYVSHIPVVGTHIGILAKDADFEIKNFVVSVGSQNITVGCLAVPDAFLASKNYMQALAEYRRIGVAFPGRAEGREALFRAGITLLEAAKTESDSEKSKELYNLAYEEFSILRQMPGAPLEYLGKALVYQTLHEYDEEIKCYELALRRYKNHPLLPIIEDQIAFRMHESSRQNRKAAYQFIFLVVKFLSTYATSRSSSNLFTSLQKHWEVPSFFIKSENKDEDALIKMQEFSLLLSFWLSKPYLIDEIIDELLERPILPIQSISNALFLLIELGAYKVAKDKINRIKTLLSESEQKRLCSEINSCVSCALELAMSNLKGTLPTFQQKLSLGEERLAFFIIQFAISKDKLNDIKDLLNSFLDGKHTVENQETLDSLLISAFMLSEPEKVKIIIEKYSKEDLSNEESPLFFPYICYVASTLGEEAAISILQSILETPYPRSWLLGAHYLKGYIQDSSGNWYNRAFLWEKRKLYQQLALFYSSLKSAHSKEKAQAFRILEAKEYVHE